MTKPVSRYDDWRDETHPRDREGAMTAAGVSDGRGGPNVWTEPTVVERARGLGWLVLSGPGSTIRIGVTAKRRLEALARFADATEAWDRLAAMPRRR